jgi:hypothetical protein
MAIKIVSSHERDEEDLKTDGKNGMSLGLVPFVL